MGHAMVMASKRTGKKRGRPPRRQLDKHQVLGLPELRCVEQMLASLRAAYDHPNRKLYFDDLFISLLLAFYNPVVRSLRGIEDASQMPGINQHLDIAAIKRSTAGDALTTFDPQLLVPLIADLRRRVSPRQIDATDDTLRGLVNRLLAFDGSYFRTPHDVAWALTERHGKRLRGRVRLNLHLAVADGCPAGVSVSGQGDATEPQALLEHVQAGQIVVADRGCFSHETVHQLREGKVDFVLRLQRSVKCEVIAERSLEDADRAAGVLSDQTVLLTGSKNSHPPAPLRLVTIQPQGDSTRPVSGKSDDGPKAGDEPSPLRLLSSIQDATVAGWMIGDVYRRRWEIELFFRWLKSCAQWEHLLSESSNGMRMQFYVAVIGTLLLAVSTGRKPDSYSFRLMHMAAAGYGSVDQALAIYERRAAERDRDRERRRQRQAEKKSS